MRRRLLPARSRLVAAILPVVLALGATLAAAPEAAPMTPVPTSRGDLREAARSEPGGCRVSAELVPTCGAWLGVGANPYGSETYDQAMVNFEARVGRTMDIAHYYVRGEATPFPTAGMVSRSSEPGRERLLLINWKPTMTWRAVANGYADAYLRSVATRIETAYDRPFFLTLHAEMESDVDPTPGSGMTAMDFRAFFRHTVQVLRAHGADHVVPIVNYTGAPHWPYVEWWDELYPGDDVVDWIAEDPYAFGQPPVWRSDFTGMVNRVQGPPSWPGFYEWVRRDHPDKPIMLAEWGVDEVGDDSQYKADFFATTLEQLRDLPMIKAVVYWDHAGAPVVGETRIGSSPQSLREFTELANHRFLRRAGEAYLDRSAVPR